uniref:Palmitoyl-protein thioesterase 1 n=1 Tax=Amphiprion percula TaxID=161767 RepID=A0A3P8SBF3_AMPPE
NGLNIEIFKLAGKTYFKLYFTRIVKLRHSCLFVQDRLGLAAMDKAGKLVFLATEGDHLQFTREWFNAILLPYARAPCLGLPGLTGEGKKRY